MELRNRLITASLVLVLSAGAAPAKAEFVVTGNVGVTSDYVFRGISFSDEDPAIQGRVDASHATGLYAGTFVSTVDKPFGASYNQVGGEEDVEIDLYAGWTRQFGVFGDYGIDIGVVNYGFSDNPDDIDWAEVYAAANWRWFSVRFHTDISGMEMGDYYRGMVRHTFADRFTVRAFAGYFDLDRVLREMDGYAHYGLGVATDFKGINFDLTYHDTDSDGERRYPGVAGDRIVLTISKRFDIYR
jgi:uncharacterized protein (TIGR02001 family)